MVIYQKISSLYLLRLVQDLMLNVQYRFDRQRHRSATDTWSDLGGYNNVDRGVTVGISLAVPRKLVSREPVLVRPLLKNLWNK